MSQVLPVASLERPPAPPLHTPCTAAVQMWVLLQGVLFVVPALLGVLIFENKVHSTLRPSASTKQSQRLAPLAVLGFTAQHYGHARQTAVIRLALPTTGRL